MSDIRPVYIIGSGSVGMALSACLVSEGRKAVAVRTQNSESPWQTIKVSLHHGADRMHVSVETVGLSKVTNLDGIVAITAKSYANKSISLGLRNKLIKGPLVVMQNGVGVERPFIEAQLGDVFRCVLYLTSQSTSDSEFGFHSIKSSPIGIISGVSSWAR